MKKFAQYLKKPVLFLGIAFAAFGSLAFVDSYFEINKNIEIFTTLYREVQTYYVDEVEPNKFIKTGIDAMLKSLDPYTNYISESEIEDFRFMTTGQYGGIGALISQKDKYIMITDPYEGFPAQKADLRAGDIILEIDGKSMENKTSADVSKLLKGQPKTEVKLKIKRAVTDEVLMKTLSREEINIKSVSYTGLVSEGIGYIKLTGFRTNSGKEVMDAYNQLKKDHKIEKLVLDLRDNPGGSLDESIRISGIFVPKGSLVVNTKGKSKQWDKSYNTFLEPLDLNIPLAVLVNGSSASASEIVSGVVQDYDRGVIIGQKTFGKGLVQTVRPLTYNTQLKVTTAKFYTPSGRCIQAIDYSERDEDEKATRIADSLKKEFKTTNGRSVFDAGGVSPDVKTELPEFANISASLLGKRLIFEYATIYKAKNPSIAKARDFKISDADFADFLTFIKDKDYDYTTQTEKMLTDFKEKAAKEEYFEAIEPEIEALKSKLQHDKTKDLVKHKDQIKQLLQDEIVSRYYFQTGRIEASFNYDTDLTEAIAILNTPARYSSILKGTK